MRMTSDQIADVVSSQGFEYFLNLGVKGYQKLYKSTEIIKLSLVSLSLPIDSLSTFGPSIHDHWDPNRWKATLPQCH